MYKRLAIVATLAVFVASQAAAVPTACQADEDTLFSCSAGKKLITVCASHDWSAGQGRLQYRFGPARKAELVLPAAPAAPASSATAGMLMFASGGGAYLRFTQAHTDYVVYSATSGQWGDKEGVAIERNGTQVAAVKCRTAALSQLGPQLFGKAGFAPDQEQFLLPD